MKFEDLLNPEFQRKYNKALRDWEAGRNLREVAGIVFGTTSKRKIDALVKHREAELSAKSERCAKLKIDGLGVLTHDGTDYVGKARVLLYSKKSVLISVPPELTGDEGVPKLWKRFRSREKTLLRELKSAVGKHYRHIISRPAVAFDDGQPPMRRNAEIWKSLDEPELAFQKHGRRVELVVVWNPFWEEEHGVYAYLDQDAAIRHIGERE